MEEILSQATYGTEDTYGKNLHALLTAPKPERAPRIIVPSKMRRLKASTLR